MTSSSALQRLLELQEVPRPVFNSLCLALSVESGHTRLSYHKDIAAAVDADGHLDVSKIRILNFSEPTSCVSLHFGCSVATMIDEWNGDNGSGHSLAGLGLRSGRIYEVLASEWLKRLQNVQDQGLASDHRKKLRHFVCAFRVNVIQVAALSLQYFEGEAPLQAASNSLSRPKTVPSREA